VERDGAIGRSAQSLEEGDHPRCLTRATDGFVNRAPGFISATLHRSIDGTKVTMYAQWRSMEDYQSMRQDPGPLLFLQEALTFATFEPGMYETVRTFKPVAKPLQLKSP
jgi:quinol monooxygenase YgiN